ncbi:hypothetical protein C1645_830777 [Glomus cerebriforme]|uniref:G domain-containing protein n=1 Tax=Glomus cerebriforme TaxID=658196 RepID=A0A397SH06_9GLOM|nr:hypothetical protein C1645_830777 [Glomus cerebriforme]
MSEKTNERINIALFGRAGYGKSSIANMLVQRDIHRNNNIFPISDGASGIPTNIHGYITETYQVFDTVGFGEPPSHNISHNKAVNEIRNYFSNCEIPLNYIFYVHKKGRITEEDIKMFKIFKEIFEWGKTNIIILITHTKPEWVENTRNLDLLRKDFGNYPVIPVDFPGTDEDEDDNIHKNKRLRSLQRLENKLTELSYEAIKLEVLSSNQMSERKFSKVINILPVAGTAYQLISSGVYYKLDKPNNAKERFKSGVQKVALDVAFMGASAGVVALCSKTSSKAVPLVQLFFKNFLKK